MGWGEVFGFSPTPGMCFQLREESGTGDPSGMIPQEHPKGSGGIQLCTKGTKNKDENLGLSQPHRSSDSEYKEKPTQTRGILGI